MSTDRAAELLALASAGDIERIQRLLPPTGDPVEDGSPETPHGVTPLMAAAASGHEAVVALLLQCGADPSRRDAHGRTAAFHARAAGYPHLAERLDTIVDKETSLW